MLRFHFFFSLFDILCRIQSLFVCLCWFFGLWSALRRRLCCSCCSIVDCVVDVIILGIFVIIFYFDVINLLFYVILLFSVVILAVIVVISRARRLTSRAIMRIKAQKTTLGDESEH